MIVALAVLGWLLLGWLLGVLLGRSVKLADQHARRVVSDLTPIGVLPCPTKGCPTLLSITRSSSAVRCPRCGIRVEHRAEL